MRATLLGSLASAAILALTFAVSPNFAWTDGPRAGPYAGDFLHEYVGGWIEREGDAKNLYDVSYFRAALHDPALTGFTWTEGAFFQALHPPFYYLWVSPLSRLEYRRAAHLWTALAVGSLLASLVLLARFDARVRPGQGGRLESRPMRSERKPPGAQRGEAERRSDGMASEGGPLHGLGWALPASLLYAPVAETLVSGQKGTFLLLLFTGTYLLLAQRRLFVAGAIFGCVAFKPQLVLVVALVMLVKREWRFIAGMAATGAVLAAQSLFVGWDACLAWVASILQPLPQHELTLRAHSWLGFARLLTGDDTGPVVLALTLALVAATLAALFRLLPGPLALGRPRLALQFSAMVLATPLVSPYLYKTYDLAILVLPLLLLAGELRRVDPESIGWRRLLLAALLLVFLMGGASAAIAARIPLQCSALASFALLWVLSRVPEPPHEPPRERG